MITIAQAVAQIGDRMATTDMGRREGAAVPLSRGQLGPRLTQCGLAKVYFRTKWHLHPSSRLATIYMGRKLGAHLTQRCWAEAYYRTKYHLDPSSRLAMTDLGRKLRALPPFGRGEAGSPSNTMSPGLRLTFLPSGILIHPAIWPQQIWAENSAAVPLFGEGELCPHLAQCGLGRALLPC